MESFGIQKARELLKLCVEIEDKGREIYNTHEIATNAQDKLDSAKKAKSKSKKSAIIVSIIMLAIIILDIVLMINDIASGTVDNSVFGDIAIIAVALIVCIILICIHSKKKKLYKEAEENYKEVMKPSNVAKREAIIQNDLDIISKNESVLKQANVTYMDDPNYLPLYTEGIGLTKAGKSAKEIIYKFDQGQARTIPAAVALLQEEERTDKIVKAQKAAAEASLLAAKAQIEATAQSTSVITNSLDSNAKKVTDKLNELK